MIFLVVKDGSDGISRFVCSILAAFVVVIVIGEAAIPVCAGRNSTASGYGFLQRLAPLFSE